MTQLRCQPAVLTLLLSLVTPPCLSGPLEPSRTVQDLRLTSSAAPALAIQIAPEFRYLGRHDFELYGAAQVERHHFVTADSAGGIERLLIFQFERYLDDNEYTYDFDRSQGSWSELGGLPFRNGGSFVHVANYLEKWRGSGTEYEVTRPFLAELGYQHADELALRSWLHVLPDRRQELVILYWEGLAGLRLTFDELVPEGASEEPPIRHALPTGSLPSETIPADEPPLAARVRLALTGFEQRARASFEILPSD